MAVRANNGRERTDRLRAQTSQPSFWASSPLVGQCEWTAGLTPGRGRRKGISNA